MKWRSTPKSRLFVLVISVLVLTFSMLTASAQVGCLNENVLWSEDFGTGTTASNHPDVLLTYQASGALQSEGVYRIINNTQQKPEWHNSPDNSGTQNGKMLVANGQAETFMQHVINDAHGFSEGNYNIALDIMNVNTPGTCAPDPLLPVIHITVEYLDEGGAWTNFTGSPYVAAPVPQTATPTWVNIGANFNLPGTGAFVPTQVRITFSDGTQGGCGNDFAADNFKFAECPQGGPAPVTFLELSASQKGSGVQVNWSTSMEINNDFFEVQKSATGNSGWKSIAHVSGAGNSQIRHEYAAMDLHPVNGMNYYRIRQVDKNRNNAFSRIVNVDVKGANSRIAVLANPFYSTLSVQFEGSARQVSARLMDMTGKVMAQENWNIPQGESRQEFSRLGQLQSGMYILSVHDKNGSVLYNAKVLKK